MEIDFLGLKSNDYNIHQDSSKDSSFPDTTWGGGVETSLSLSTTTRSSSNHQTEDEGKKKKKKKKWELGGERMINNYNHGGLGRTEQPGLVLVSRPVYGLSSSSGFLYYQNEHPRNKSKLSSQPPSSSRMHYSGCTAGPPTPSSAIGLAGDMRMCPRGYTPTVAMARRATLARFLKKRLHRINRWSEEDASCMPRGDE